MLHWMSSAVPELVLLLGMDRFSTYIGVPTSCTFHHRDNRDMGTVECTELYLRLSSALPMHLDVAISALDCVNATRLVAYI